jgi:1,4-alpha-glucan branching enzyme
VYQYKFNNGGCSSCWYGDPLNRETNPADNNNSVLRLTRLFWFQYYGTVVGEELTRITVGLVHADGDSIVTVQLSTGISASDTLVTREITQAFDRNLRIVDVALDPAINRLHYVRLLARNQRGDSVLFATGGVLVPSLPLPSYARHGVTLPSTASGDSTTFRLRVPEQPYVLVRIAPVGQDPAAATPITMRNGGGGNWWTNVKLSAGTYEYIYEFADGTRITDPWGRWNGTKGSRFTVGPAGLTGDDYAWRTTAYQRPPLNKLVIYELHIGEFTGGFLGLAAGQGTFDHLRSLLPYFDSLGVNAIELMPVTDFGEVGRSGFSWGYDVNSSFALEPSYGTPYDLKELVDSAHALGIAVLLDVVFNHLNDTGPLWRMLPDESANPYFKAGTDLRPNEDDLLFFRDLDHWTVETQELVYEALKMWIDEYRIDGFRYDYTQGIGWHPDSTRFGILGWSNRIAQEYGGSVYQIVEHLPESPALLFYSGITSGWHDSFHDELLDKEAYNYSSTLSNIAGLVLGLGAYGSNDTPAVPSSYAGRTEPVNATVNHDEQSLLYQMTQYGFPPSTDSVALLRDKVYGALMFTSLGIPMLWQGVEFGAPRGWRDGGERLSYRPLETFYLNQDRGKSHVQHYRTLIRQRRMNPALFGGTMRILKSYPSYKSLVWGFEDTGTGSKVMILSNFIWSDAVLQDVPWLGMGTWYDVFDQSIVNISDSVVSTFTIPPYTVRMYSNRSDVELGIVSSVAAAGPSVPSEYVLEQNYPNPFNPSTVIRFALPRSEYVRLAVYDLLGKEIAVLREGVVEAGRHTVSWDGKGSAAPVASGVYFVRLTTPGFSAVRRAVLVR